MGSDTQPSVAPVVRRRLDMIVALLALDSAVLVGSAAANWQSSAVLGFVAILLVLALLLYAVLMAVSATG